MIRTEFSERCPERSSAQYTARMWDEAGARITVASLSTLTLTLYDDVTKTNIVAEVDILNTGRGTVAEVVEVGVLVTLLTIALAPTDNVLVNVAAYEELHIGLLRYTWNAGVKGSAREISFYVKNLEKIS